VTGAIALLVVAMTFASTRLPELRDSFSQLLVVEGVEGNDRWDLWSGTAASFARSPLVGSGLGTYRHVIALDKPATGTAVLEQAHNDWLEWASTTGVAGVVLLILFVAALVAPLLPGRVRRLRFELRYPLAGAAVALLATALHETVGFGLQSPLNRYLAAVWVGLVWGIVIRVNDGRKRAGVAAAAAPGRTDSVPRETEAEPESVDGPISDDPSDGSATQRGLFEDGSGGDD
jgi:O-antigen ligase